MNNDLLWINQSPKFLFTFRLKKLSKNQTTNSNNGNSSANFLCRWDYKNSFLYSSRKCLQTINWFVIHKAFLFNLIVITIRNIWALIHLNEYTVSGCWVWNLASLLKFNLKINISGLIVSHIPVKLQSILIFELNFVIGLTEIEIKVFTRPEFSLTIFKERVPHLVVDSR